MKDVHVPTPSLRTTDTEHAIAVVTAQGSTPDEALESLRQAGQKRGDSHARALPATWHKDVEKLRQDGMTGIPGGGLIWFFEVHDVRLVPVTGSTGTRWHAYGTLVARSERPLTFTESESEERGDWPTWYIPIGAGD